MSIPKLNIPKHKYDPNKIKARNILFKLRNIKNYDPYDEREAIELIEKHNINKSLFDFPYGSFDEFKKHVLAGEFDFDPDRFIKEHTETETEKKETEELVRNHKAWIIH